MNLKFFLSEFNGYNVLGGGCGDGGKLNGLMQRDAILMPVKDDIRAVEAFIKSSSLEDVFLLINPEAKDDEIYIRRVLWAAWYGLHLEKKLDDMKDLNFDDPELKSLLFDEMKLADLEEISLNASEVDEDDDDKGENEDDAEDEDEDEDEEDSAEDEDEDGEDDE